MQAGPGTMAGPPANPPPFSGAGAGAMGPGLGDCWYLSEGGAVQGPFMWHQIAARAELQQFAPDAMLRNEAWQTWAPLQQYLPRRPGMNREVQGLIPSRYDAMFYAFLGLFIFGIVVAAFQIVLGILVLVISVAGEIMAVVLEIRQRGTSVSSILGNTMAAILILIQLGGILVAILAALE